MAIAAIPRRSPLHALVAALLAAGCAHGSVPPDAGANDATTSLDASVLEDGAVDAAVDAGPGTFNVVSAAATGSTQVTVVFDAVPEASQATTLSNYAIPGLTLSGTPALAGSTVTLATSTQDATPYTITVTGVTRASDGAALANASVDFTGRAAFNVATATSPGGSRVAVTFDAEPNAAQATALSSYAITGLTLSGTPTLVGSTVTFSTSAQAATTYRVTVTGVTRASDGEPLTVAAADFTGRPPFDVVSAVATGSTRVAITFDAPPNAAQATTLASYAIPGLTLVGTPELAGNVVTLTTSAQAASGYTVTVTGVTRASDAEPLTTASAGFTGTTTFNVVSAVSTGSHSLVVTFDAPPNAAQAGVLGNYHVPGLSLSGSPLLVGSSVTLTTSAQTDTVYRVTVLGVTRASDAEALNGNYWDFTGHPVFNVASAASTGNRQITVTFDAPPNPSQAATLGNYSVSGLSLSGTPSLAGSTVTITTSAQSATTYTVVVTGVTRQSDAEPLNVSTADFTGTPPSPPTVTGVVVTATSPDNGTTPYNTGTATVTITGTHFASVVCPAGVMLDDLDGAGGLEDTAATSCTVVSDTQITATFPRGIRTNGSIGWNVQVTNNAGTNATSTVPFVPRAGLLVSEVYTGASGATSHEYVEVYNPTATAITVTPSGIDLHLHIRSSTGTDYHKPLTFVTSGVVPSHGFLLLVSSDSAEPDAWYAHRDATYSASSGALVADGAAYLSLSATADYQVIDKVGWGTQPAPGFEGNPAGTLATGQGIERKPAGGAGHATDTDSNANDFNVPTTTLTPRGTADPAQP